MSYSSTQKPVFIARKHGTSGLGADVAAGIAAGGQGIANVINALTGKGGMTGPGGGAAPAPESSVPWVPILLGAAVIGGVVIYKRRKK